MKKQDNRVIVIGLGIILVLLIILICLRITYKEPDYTVMTEEELNLSIEEDKNAAKKEMLSKLSEKDRMEHYASDFVERIDLEKYEDAYEMLYGEFKENYFPTLESFEKYAKEEFPKLISVEHTNIERLGDIYVLWTTVYDLMRGRDEGVEIKFVIRENDLNDFDLSFSVNEKGLIK